MWQSRVLHSQYIFNNGAAEIGLIAILDTDYLPIPAVFIRRADM